MTIVLSALTCLVLATWIARHFILTWTLRHDPVLLTTTYEKTVNPPVRVSVIVPARNESHNIGECVESLLSQDYARLGDGSHFEIIVVDDRSEDETAEIIEKYASQDSRVKLIRNTELPEGWTGKNYSLHLGAQAANDPAFMLFVDADTRHAPSNLSQAVTFALEHKTDMFSLIMPIRNVTFWEKVIQPITGSVLCIRYPIWKVNDPKSKMAFGNGQYMLIRREAYEQVGGHEAVRDRLLEDIAMAKRIKQAGLDLKVAYTADVSHIRMYRSFSEIRQGWARIYLAGMNRSLGMLSFAAMMLLVFSLSPYLVFIGTVVAGLLVGFSTGLWVLLGLSAAGMLGMLSVMVRFYRTFQTDPRYLAFHLLGCLITMGILLSAIAMLFSNRGLTWKGMRYDTRPFAKS